MSRKRACTHFLNGRCNYGNKCKFSHEPDTPCPNFSTKKGCNKGVRCRFSHDSSNVLRQTQATAPAAADEAESAFRRWTYMIPRITALHARQRTNLDNPRFFKIGFELLSTSDPGIRQQIIKKLASEEGLQMVVALVDSMATDSESQLTATFKDRVLPFYSMLSNPNVVSSIILEQDLEVIYNVLYGPRGHRAIVIFQFTAKALALTCSGANILESHDVSALDSSLTVLKSILELNQAAQILEELPTATETISACICGKAVSPGIQLKLDKIRLRLGLGSLIPAVTPARSVVPDPAFFELQRDLPGDLSPFGARHDNDHQSIKDIEILPTAQEIQSDRIEYLPLHDPSKNHLPGLPGLLDRHFRLLREESIGPLRDAVGRELGNLASPANGAHPEKGREQKERTNIYRNVTFARLDIDRRKGLRLVLEFDQPSVQQNLDARRRQDWWHNSKRLQASTLVCLATSSGRIIFFLVDDPTPTPPHPKGQQTDESSPDRQLLVSQERYQRKVDEQPSLYKDGSRAAVMLKLVQNHARDVTWIVQQMTPGSDQLEKSLVEFPGALLPSFQPPLEALQTMSRKLDLPFADTLAPHNATTIPPNKPPGYAQVAGFSFDLSPLTRNVQLRYSPDKDFDYGAFSELTDLDIAQQEAVLHTLQSGLALIQGPPGTGKSFTGVAIIKVLLQNRAPASLGPIICVCYTNHALDQLLEHLVKDGVKQIVRIGSRSKSELLQNLNLHYLTQQVEQTKTEKSEKWLCYQQLNQDVEELEILIEQLRNPGSISNICSYLELHHPFHFQQLFNTTTDDEGFQEVRRSRSDVLKKWVRGGAMIQNTNRSNMILVNSDLRNMSRTERRNLYQYWIQQCSERFADQVMNAWESYLEKNKQLERIGLEQQLRCLSQAQVIGVTTTGLARNTDVLRRVHAKVLVNEEAGEVLEAHTLTALLPSIEHVILIGDHEQLRPQVKNYELRQEHPRGEQYSLDISLFERLVRPKFGSPICHFSSLKTQRRMHPSIACLIRNTIYPRLEDHPKTSDYPAVDGVRKRLFWLNHNHREDSSDGSVSKSFSKSNKFEIEMVAALVSHLVRQGTYSVGEITVLTPYLGQLQKMRSFLQNSLEIVVGDRDVDELEAQGLIETQDRQSAQVSISKTTLLNAVRIATVDNFQGEEANVVILSFVRSNPQRKCGFLNSSNRINVALSRARHGMYIIGDTQTASSIPMWSEVIAMLEQNGNVGDSLALTCPRHPDREDATGDVLLDCSAATHAPTSATAKRFTKPFAAWRDVKEPKTAANMPAPNPAETLATRRVKSLYPTSGCLVDTCLSPYNATKHKSQLLSNAKRGLSKFCQVVITRLREIDLDANPCIIPDCGHIITLENLDRVMSLREFYDYDERNECIIGIKVSSEPFSISGQKSCPSCRGPLRNINRYGRIVRRAWIDEATKKFIVWANAQFVPLVAQIEAVEEKLKSVGEEASHAAPLSSNIRNLGHGSVISFTGSRSSQIKQVRVLSKKDEPFPLALGLRNKVEQFLNQVDEKEQPFKRIYDLVQDARRHQGIQHNMAWTPDMLQTRNRLLAAVLLLRCDYAILASFLASCQRTPAKIKACFSAQRKDCVALVKECRARNQPANEVEGHLYFARYIALERGLTDTMPEGSEPLAAARQHLSDAETLCKSFPGQTKGILSEVEEARKMLRESTFYMPVSNEEKAAVYAAMAADFRGTGHWYYCANGHPFTIGECGAPMQTSRCPQCGAPVGGNHHRAVGGVTRATDMEEQFGRMRL
ncbi:MAG: hypothetical protein Q9190_000426 [Brigantiaea leucoxantha]